MRTSYSALNTFKICRLKYKFQEIDKIKAPKSKEAVFGSIIHSVLKFLHTPRTTPPTIEEVLERYNNLWNSEIYQDKQEEAAALSEGIKILQNYYEKNNPKNFNVVNLETKFSFSITEDIEISGIIDRIDRTDRDSFEVIDYKTSKNLPSQEEVDKDFQLSIYHMAVTNRWPKLNKPIKLSLYFLKHNIKLSTIRTRQQIEDTKQHILEIVEEIKKNDFPPIPNPLCDWCEYQPHCPMFKHKFRKDKDTNIQAVLKEYYELKLKDKKISQRIAELQKIINDYCDDKNIERVFGDGIYVTRTLQQRYGYDLEKIKSILKPLGRWEEVVSVDPAKLKKVLSQLPYEKRKEIEKAKEIKKEFKSLSLKKEK